MEAQFAWDDKTIRQTFIRKVWLSRRRGTPATSTAQSWQRVPPPAGLRHPLSAAAGHGRHSCALFLLVKPERIPVSLPSFGEMVIWLLLRPQRACQVLHPDPPWPVHGVVVSENKSEKQCHHRFWSVMTFDLLICSQLHVLYNLHRTVLLRRAEVNLLYTKSDPITKSSLVFVFFLRYIFFYHNFIQTGGSFHGISFCWSSL